jgi:lipopolysaccharide export LptBFGC system permease protein LptF
MRDQGAEANKIRPMRPKLVPALILIVLGIAFLLSNLGLLPRLGPLFAQWWPVILIVVGATMLLRR